MLVNTMYIIRHDRVGCSSRNALGIGLVTGHGRARGGWPSFSGRPPYHPRRRHPLSRNLSASTHIPLLHFPSFRHSSKYQCRKPVVAFLSSRKPFVPYDRQKSNGGATYAQQMAFYEPSRCTMRVFHVKRGL